MSERPIRPSELVLGLVEPEREDEVRRLLAEDPLFREEVDRLRTTVATLEQLDRSAWRPAPPPPLSPAIVPTVERRRRRRWFAATTLAAAVAAALLLVVVLPGGSSRPVREVALHAIGDVPGSATLTISGDEAELRGSGMPPSGPDDYYEAWLQDRRGRMVSMGTFRVAANGKVVAHMPVAVDLTRYRRVDVSLEPDDGDPAHSATSVMRATL
jgi:anti-sigma-K factor RskA